MPTLNQTGRITGLSEGLSHCPRMGDERKTDGVGVQRGLVYSYKPSAPCMLHLEQGSALLDAPAEG